MDPVTRGRRRTALLVGLVFVLGVATGALVARAVFLRRVRELVMGDPAALRARVTLYALDQRLRVDGTQRAAAEGILRAQAPRYREALERCRPEVHRLRREFLEQLGPTLDPGQREALESLTREAERHR
jgi:hypothetical protein